MTDISAKDVMALRNETGLPMMDCKQALMENGGDPEKALEWLRKKLKGKMDTRTDRAAGEGRVEVLVNGDSAAIVEIRAETDFTAKNDTFLSASRAIVNEAMKASAGDVAATPAITEKIDSLRISTGENISFARGRKMQGAGSKFGSYLHHDGKTGVIVEAAGDVPDDLLRSIGMHITAADPRPLGVSVDTIPADVVEREKKFAIDQAMESGKPREIAEKMVEGKMRKFYETVALLEQPFVMNPDQKVKDLLPKGATIKSFVRWQVGG